MRKKSNNKTKFAILITIILIFSYLPANAVQIDMEKNLPLTGWDDPWWNSDWQFRKSIVINHSKIEEDLTNFPVLISFESDTDLSLNAQPNGNDIVFVDENGNKLNHEIEYYNNSLGKLISWVKIPMVYSGADTTIYIYYSNPTASNQQNPEEVWEDGYVLVQHMSETGDNVYDSTSFQNDGLSTRTTFNETCKIDGGRHYNNDDDFITVEDMTYCDTALTAEAWIFYEYNQYYPYLNIFCEGPSYLESDWILYLRTGFDGTGIDFGVNNHTNYFRNASTPSNTWFHLTATYDAGEVAIYVDGEEVGRNNIFASSINNYFTDLGLGNDNDGGQDWTFGYLDEVRVSNIVRNENWIKTSYENMNEPQTFYSIGPVEIKPSDEPVISNPLPQNGAIGVATNLSELSFNLTDFQGDEMYYDITTSPDIGHDGVGGLENGTYTLPVSGLNYDTTYTWFVNVTDPSGSGNWTNQTFWFMTRPENYVPNLVNITPSNGATDVYFNPTLSVIVEDLDYEPITVIFRSNYGGSWETLGEYTDTGGEFTQTTLGIDELDTIYYWSLNVTDGKIWVNQSNHFTTAASIPLTLKWSNPTPAGFTSTGPLVADVDNDSRMEIVRTGVNGLIVLDAETGDTDWFLEMEMWNDHCPVEIIDLNKDGILEIICSKENGTMAVHGNNGTEYWYVEDAPLYNKYCVAGDIDADGYPEVFVTTAGSITALTHDGQIFAETYTYYPCFGGLSLGDTNQDGVFELYLNERSYHYSEYGKGVRAFWASNLTERWYREDILCSSHCPTLVDVDKDGILDVVSLQQHGSDGAIVLNSTDGSEIHYSANIPGMKCHSQPTIHDIDNDGNFELIASHKSRPVIWDLYDWEAESGGVLDGYGRLPYYCTEPPAVADITGDGDVEIIASTYNNIKIFNNEYEEIGTLSLGLTQAQAFIMAQDIDEDGSNELIFNVGSTVYVYETNGATPEIKALSQHQFYSQHRGRSPYYTQFGPSAPVVKDESPVNKGLNYPINPDLSVYVYDYQKDLINITFRTNVSGNWESIYSYSNEKAGTFEVNTTGLDLFNLFNHTYYWSVNVTDSGSQQWINRTYFFKTELEPLPWWNSDWQFRKSIVINHSKIEEDLTNFPVLISFESDTDLSLNAQPNGNDIVFTDRIGSKLNHEIEYYNGTSGNLIAWANVPVVSSDFDTILYIYYGNPVSSNQQNPQGVWENGYVLVQHMNENGDNLYDSTSYHNDGISHGTTYIEDCQIDGGQYYDDDDYIVVDDMTYCPTTLTAEAWVYRDDTQYINIFCDGSHYNECDWALYLRTASENEGIDFSINSHTSSIRRSSTPQDEWFHLTVTYNAGTVVMYVDGIQTGAGNIDNYINDNYADLGIGNDNDGGQPWASGNLDEVRVSNIVRNENWIKTSYENMKNPETFYTIGVKEFLPSGEPVVSNPSPANEATDVATDISELSFTLTDLQGDEMYYNITTSPDIGHDGVGGLTNGTYALAVSGLNYDTTYTWYVNATDPSGSGNWTNETFIFTTIPFDAEPPVIYNVFAGNPGDKGGPYFYPETDIPSPNGYYVNDSFQQEDWIFINCTVDDETSEIQEVWLHWLNETTWTNDSYQFLEIEENYFEFNSSSIILDVGPGYHYSFDILVIDTAGNEALYQWTKRDAHNNTGQRISVQLAGHPTDIDYIPYYLNEAHYSGGTSGNGHGPEPSPYNSDLLHHDQGPDGTTTDTGYLNANYPTETIEHRHCAWYTGYWFDETITASPGTLDNIYFHNWWSSNSNEMEFGYGKSQDGVYSTWDRKQYYETSNESAKSYITYDDRIYNLEANLMIIEDPLPLNDNEIYEFFIHHFTGYGENPSIINNISIMSFVIFNIPDNTTLETMDTDGDYLNDYQELFFTFTSPFVADTDNDGTSDYSEFLEGSDPNNYLDEAVDTNPPQIINLQANPDIQHSGGYVNITCDFIDGSDIETAMLNITYPDGSIHNETMFGGYYHNSIYTLNGTYNFFVWVEDVYGNSNFSKSQTFEIYNPQIANYSIMLLSGWNLISLPINQSCHKNNMTIYYQGYNYTWVEATQMGIIIPHIYRWNLEQHIPTDMLNPGEGYWIYVEVNDSCEIWVSGYEYIENDYISEIYPGWNLIGLPFNDSVEKENLIIIYGGDEYTWNQASENGTILPFIFGWNVSTQNYIIANLLEFGNGYWMYSEAECILKHSH